MEKVTIKFVGGGEMTVKDAKGATLPTNRVVVYMHPGSEYPVAEFESGGSRYGALVSSLEVATKDAKGGKA